MSQITKVKNGFKYFKNGWTYVSIKGKPFERGVAYGKLIKDDMIKVMKTIDFIIYNDYGVNWSFFVEACKKYYSAKIESQFPEFYEEMRGFAKGANMDIHNVIAWNNYFTLTESWWANMPEEELIAIKGSIKNVASGVKEGGQKERCTAFIAVGDWTKDGKIVVGHNNFSNFADGQFAKYVLSIQPTTGKNILMMGFPGWIWSGTDFFVTSAGIIGTETTIGGFISYENNLPISCRIRQAMQYGETLDDYEKILLEGNSGDYANSWLFADINKNEIMRIELGLKYHNTERTNNGYFIGFNAAYDPRIRNLECVNSGFDDLRRHQGARRVRLEQLIKDYKGKLDIEISKSILGDHYDTYLNKENPCSRTCCSHYDLDAREYMSDPSRPKPFQPRGALDGNVCDTNMATKMSFCLRWGNSCGIPFYKNNFCDENPIWGYLRDYLEDRPQQQWTDFFIDNSSNIKRNILIKTNKNKHKNNTNKFIKKSKTKRNKLTK